MRAALHDHMTLYKRDLVRHINPRNCQTKWDSKQGDIGVKRSEIISPEKPFRLVEVLYVDFSSGEVFAALTLAGTGTVVMFLCFNLKQGGRRVGILIMDIASSPNDVGQLTCENRAQEPAALRHFMGPGVAN